MKLLRIATFVSALLVCLAITFWPPLMYGDRTVPGHGTTSLILLGLCAGIVFGSGILQRTPLALQRLCAIAAWLAIAAVAALAL